MVKIWPIVLAAIVGIIVLLELSLRLIFGFGNPPLYIADKEIGYLLAPNQKVRRFGNCIEIDRHSMRSESFSEKRSDGTLRVFLLGDSIINGAWWTDQAKTISALVEKQLQIDLDRSFERIEVLNASANSWGPRNQLAYLKRFGVFEAQILVLVMNTDDLFATAPTSLVVGRDRSYPDRKPRSALFELFNYFFSRSKPIPGMDGVNTEKGDRVGINLEAVREMKSIATQAKAEFMLAITPLKREIAESSQRDYERKARERLARFTQSEQIPYIDFLPLFRASQQPENLYRDHIHLSPEGDRLVSDTIAKSLLVRKLISIE